MVSNQNEKNKTPAPYNIHHDFREEMPFLHGLQISKSKL